MDSDDEWNLDEDEEVVMPRELPKGYHRCWDCDDYDNKNVFTINSRLHPGIQFTDAAYC